MTLKFTLVSDLHLDIGKETPVLPGGRLLVMAGDTCEYREMRKYDEDKYGILNDPNIKMSNKGRINRFFVEQCAEKYDDVIIIAGNHEHYRGTFDKTIPHMKAELPDNFRVLEKDCFEIDDVLFIGATLWTDMNRGDPLTVQTLKYGMNDYDCVRKLHAGNQYVRLDPRDTINEHIRTLQYFKVILDNPHNLDKKIVMVTHMAPTHLSIAPQYANDKHMNGGYYSDLSEFILDNPRIKVWCHGHTHTKFDYMVGDYTRVVCNPRGYISNYSLEYTGFDPNWVIEV